MTKLSVGIVIYEIILECIQENNTWTKRKIDEIYLYISRTHAGEKAFEMLPL